MLTRAVIARSGFPACPALLSDPIGPGIGCLFAALFCLAAQPGCAAPEGATPGEPASVSSESWPDMRLMEMCAKPRPWGTLGHEEYQYRGFLRREQAQDAFERSLSAHEAERRAFLDRRGTRCKALHDGLLSLRPLDADQAEALATLRTSPTGDAIAEFAVCAAASSPSDSACALAGTAIPCGLRRAAVRLARKEPGAVEEMVAAATRVYQSQGQGTAPGGAESVARAIRTGRAAGCPGDPVGEALCAALVRRDPAACPSGGPVHEACVAEATLTAALFGDPAAAGRALSPLGSALVDVVAGRPDACAPLLTPVDQGCEDHFAHSEPSTSLFAEPLDFNVPW